MRWRRSLPSWSPLCKQAIKASRNIYPRVNMSNRTLKLLLFDNTLWDGAVADPDNQDDDTQALRALNDRLHKDERVSISLVPIGDGLTMARKR